MIRDRDHICSITRLHKGVLLVRKGRGFSVHELSKASLSLSQAITMKVRIDFRRKTVYESNVSLLKARAAAQIGKKADSSRVLEETA